MRISLSIGFSRAVESAPDTSKIKVLYQLFNPIAKQIDSRVISFLEEMEISTFSIQMEKEFVESPLGLFEDLSDG